HTKPSGSVQLYCLLCQMIFTVHHLGQDSSCHVLVLVGGQHMYAHMCACMCVCVRAYSAQYPTTIISVFGSCGWLCVCARVLVCVCVQACLCVCRRACVCVCVCVCVCRRGCVCGGVFLCV